MRYCKECANFNTINSCFNKQIGFDVCEDDYACTHFDTKECEMCAYAPTCERHIMMHINVCEDFRRVTPFSLVPDWQDCAEFETRVAMKLAKAYAYNKPKHCQEFLGCPIVGKMCGKCEECLLAETRIEVEQEFRR